MRTVLLPMSPTDGPMARGAGGDYIPGNNAASDAGVVGG